MPNIVNAALIALVAGFGFVAVWGAVDEVGLPSQADVEGSASDEPAIGPWPDPRERDNGPGPLRLHEAGAEPAARAADAQEKDDGERQDDRKDDRRGDKDEGKKGDEGEKGDELDDKEGGDDGKGRDDDEGDDDDADGEGEGDEDD